MPLIQKMPYMTLCRSRCVLFFFLFICFDLHLHSALFEDILSLKQEQFECTLSQSHQDLMGHTSDAYCFSAICLGPVVDGVSVVVTLLTCISSFASGYI